MEISLIQKIAVAVVPMLLAITFHELAHGLAAYKLGDGTAKAMGRLTINPIAHIDIFGTIIIPLVMFITTNGQFMFGYAKPVPINPYNFRNPRRDMALSAAAGPAMNIALAVASLLSIKLILYPLSGALPEGVIKPLILIMQTSMIVNVILAAFNLIPIPPLDGGRIAVGFLPIKYAIMMEKIEPYGMIIVIILIVTHIADIIITPLINLFLALLSLF